MKNNLNLVERTFVTQNMSPKIDNNLSPQIFYRKITISESPDEETPPVVTNYDSPGDEAQVEGDEVTIVDEKKSEGLKPALDRPTPAKSKRRFAFNAKKKVTYRRSYLKTGSKATSGSRRRKAGGIATRAGRQRFVFDYVFLQSDLKFSKK